MLSVGGGDLERELANNYNPIGNFHISELKDKINSFANNKEKGIRLIRTYFNDNIWTVYTSKENKIISSPKIEGSEKLDKNSYADKGIQPIESLADYVLLLANSKKPQLRDIVLLGERLSNNMYNIFGRTHC